MYPVLILREECICFIVLVFLLITANIYHLGKDSRSFFTMMLFAIAHVVMDFVTVITVNHTDTVPRRLNDIVHVIFYLTAMGYSAEFVAYVMRLCRPKLEHAFRIVCYGTCGAYLLVVPFLPIDYVQVNGTYSSTGTAAYIGYGIAFAFFIIAIITLLANLKNLTKQVKFSLLPMTLLLMVAEVTQVFKREVLFTGGAITVVTVSFFFSLENPVNVFKRKALTDALTGVGSRHSFDEKLAELDKAFRANAQRKYAVAYFDINDLKSVNSNFGHSEGDVYIVHIATALLSEIRRAVGVYRVGGDEFVALYDNIDEATVKKEMDNAKARCAVGADGMKYAPSVAVGYAVSNEKFKSLYEVVRTADFIMYRNKSDTKSAERQKTDSEGTTLNLSSLTDNIFNAMCESSPKNYPYITNLETGVSRVSRNWVDYFGLPGEFMSNFDVIWMEHIHPDDRKAYVDDISDVITGKKHYHRCKYRAKNTNGIYVWCECSGAIYHGKNGEVDIFAGTMTNHGVDELLDSATGFENFLMMDNYVQATIDNKRQAVIVKLRIVNLPTVNMLYGYTAGEKVVKCAAEVVSQLVGDTGRVFTNEGTDISIFLPHTLRDSAEELYHEIVKTFADGIRVSNMTMPLEIIARGLEIDHGLPKTRKMVRGGLISALRESRGELVFFENTMSSAAAVDMDMLTDLHKDAIGESEHFTMCYQPVVNTQTLALDGVEALLRWRHPGYGEVGPIKFIHFLENDPCYYKLGLRMLKKALTEMKAVQEKRGAFNVSVNITALQLNHPTFKQDVLDVLREVDYPTDRLVLELTERCKEMDEEYLGRTIADIRRSGIKIALDDMGTGHNTITLLMNIPFDYVKLDRDFVMGLQHSDVYRVFVEALVDGMKFHSYRLCFEGIENEKMLEGVRKFGPSLSQGYLFGKPMQPEKIVDVKC